MTEPLSLVFLPASGVAPDAELLAELTARLAPDVRDGLFRIAGSPPATGLCVLLLPVSPDLVDQRSLWEAALADGRKQERPGFAQLMVLHLRPHDGDATAAAGLTRLPADGRAITEWERRDAAWDDVVRCLRAVAVRGYLAPPPPVTPPLAAPSTLGEDAAGRTTRVALRDRLAGLARPRHQPATASARAPRPRGGGVEAVEQLLLSHEVTLPEDKVRP